MDNPVPERLSRAREVLLRHYGYSDFRPAQRRVVQSVLAGRDTLAVLPTGGGKSICFQVPAMALGGFAVVVSPLISLMQDQVSALKARGIEAELLNSTLSSLEQDAVLASLVEGRVRLVYTSPERLPRLTRDLTVRGFHRPTLLAIDEAHCITEWGHDFRPAYRQLRRLRRQLGMPPTVALTGSATPEVRQDITNALGLRQPDLHLGSFDRRNLWFGVVRVRNERERLERLISLLKGDDRLAIVYAPTRNTSEGLTRILSRAGFRSAAYHAGLSKSRRADVLERFLDEDVEVVAATCAFGMGIDQPRVRLVVHWTMPPTPESYYQEAGRAGRDGCDARCVLLTAPGDADLHRRQLEVTFPPRRLLERIWYQPDGRRAVPSNVLDAADRLARELKPDRGPVDWRPVEARRSKALQRIEAVERYAAASGCRRAALLGYFGERLEHCAGCDHCARRPGVRCLSGEAGARFRRLHRALATCDSPWGGSALEPATIRRLAVTPPASVDELAAVPGVGAALVERLGGTILRALEIEVVEASVASHPLHETLRRWRSGVALGMGVPEYGVLPDVVLERIAEVRPRDRDALRRVEGLGPRALAKWGEALLQLCETGPPNGLG
jgi:ATP-dependent DNA helicase RecQ